jgi:hypothetical protein
VFVEGRRVGCLLIVGRCGRREWGRREERWTDCETFTYNNNVGGTIVCLNCAQLIEVNYVPTIPYRKGTPKGCGDVWLCIATHCRKLGVDAWSCARRAWRWIDKKP